MEMDDATEWCASLPKIDHLQRTRRSVGDRIPHGPLCRALRSIRLTFPLSPGLADLGHAATAAVRWHLQESAILPFNLCFAIASQFRARSITVGNRQAINTHVNLNNRNVDLVADRAEQRGPICLIGSQLPPFDSECLRERPQLVVTKSLLLRHDHLLGTFLSPGLDQHSLLYHSKAALLPLAVLLDPRSFSCSHRRSPFPRCLQCLRFRPGRRFGLRNLDDG
mmetsp:Transcript_84922/g.254580  ORF Transcript_84922/g.254580 Transcript_84922/m.254580 type:complete len:223 (+) Transcript_84922:1251-1919(+)